MSTIGRLSPASAWTHWYRRALPAYWCFLFFTTHLPELRWRVSLAGEPPDKTAHVVAFGLLAFFYWRFAETFGELTGWFVWRAGFWLILYAAFDELTQRYVARSVNVRDWLFSALGLSVALALLEAQRRWRRRRFLRPAAAQRPGRLKR